VISWVACWTALAIPAITVNSPRPNGVLALRRESTGMVRQSWATALPTGSHAVTVSGWMAWPWKAAALVN
jgi:hypothetical protein